MTLKLQFLLPEEKVKRMKIEIETDPIKLLPQNLIFSIFSYLNTQDLNACCLVNKNWKIIVLKVLENLCAPGVGNQKNEKAFVFGGIRRNPTIMLPKDMIFSIFSYLNSKDLTSCCLVSKNWKKFANNGSLWKKIVLNEIAYGKKQWDKHFGDVGLEPPLPKNIIKILKSSCPFWKKKFTVQTHILMLIPATVDNIPFSLNFFDKFAKINTAQGTTRYNHFWPSAKRIYGYREVGASYWVLITKDVLDGSIDETYGVQKKFLETAAKITKKKYRMIKVIEAVVYIFMTFVTKGIRLFDIQSRCQILCKEKVSHTSLLAKNPRSLFKKKAITTPLSVGSFMYDGLCIEEYNQFSGGAAALPFKPIISKK